MARRTDPGSLPYWPRMLSRDLACAYLGVTGADFDRLGLEPVQLGKRKVWDRNQLDGFVDSMVSAGAPVSSRDHWLARVRDAYHP
jgi:hypothetical protein